MCCSLHHHQENVHKSTSVHACVLSPSSCRFISLKGGGGEAEVRQGRGQLAPTSPASLPPYDPATTLLLYPSPGSVSLSHPRLAPLLPRVQRVVVIESTWQKGGAVYSTASLGLSSLPAVHLDRSYESTYWRYQELGRNYLSTLEAIYHCCREMLQIDAAHAGGGQRRAAAMQGTQLDDLLYLYAHRHMQVHRRYDPQAVDTEGDTGDAEVKEGSPAGSAQSGPALRRPKPPPRAWRPTDPSLQHVHHTPHTQTLDTHDAPPLPLGSVEQKEHAGIA